MQNGISGWGGWKVMEMSLLQYDLYRLRFELVLDKTTPWCVLTQQYGLLCLCQWRQKQLSYCPPLSDQLLFPVTSDPFEISLNFQHLPAMTWLWLFQRQSLEIQRQEWQESWVARTRSSPATHTVPMGPLKTQSFGTSQQWQLCMALVTFWHMDAYCVTFQHRMCTMSLPATPYDLVRLSRFISIAPVSGFSSLWSTRVQHPCPSKTCRPRHLQMQLV